MLLSNGRVMMISGALGGVGREGVPLRFELPCL
jgi:hypothetical protein